MNNEEEYIENYIYLVNERKTMDEKLEKLVVDLEDEIRNNDKNNGKYKW